MTTTPETAAAQALFLNSYQQPPVTTPQPEYMRPQPTHMEWRGNNAAGWGSAPGTGTAVPELNLSVDDEGEEEEEEGSSSNTSMSSSMSDKSPGRPIRDHTIPAPTTPAMQLNESFDSVRAAFLVARNAGGGDSSQHNGQQQQQRYAKA